jgi:leucyl-tRNA synthetase
MDERYDFITIERKWQAFWEEHNTFQADDRSDRPKFYGLEFFPYPSGSGLSVGHCKNYVPTDVYCRYKSMKGYNVLHPMGWDAFGQPAENEAIKRGRNPGEMVPEYAANYRRTLKLIGASYDWSREINSSSPDYYRWTQWIFLQLYKRGLAYRSETPINWCPSCKTGLANEEVKEGRCWRCDTPVEKRPMPQWYFRITSYAERLLQDLDVIDWPEGIKQMQREWIGKSEGAEVDFAVDGVADLEPITVFTTRPDTLWGATFMVLAPEHPLVSSLLTAEQSSDAESYIRRSQTETEIDRMNAERTKTGVFTGSYAINPVNGSRIPIWIADYVLMGYGTGAIMAVPAHDQRDFDFARKYGIPIELVYITSDGPQHAEEMTQAVPDGGKMRSFAPRKSARCKDFPFAGMPNDKETVHRVIAWLEVNGVGRGRVNYRLRDWLISRQRYWGAPIPIIHCDVCGEAPVPVEDLPVLLPAVEKYQPSGTGESPLATIPEFVNAFCPKCGAHARRETDTMGGFACSSWYFLRFADPHNDREFASREKIDYWLPVDCYVGGAEHAVMHLLYARFWTKALYDAGLVGFTEPFRTLRNQGTVLAYTPGRRPRTGEAGGAEEGESVVDWIVLKPEERESYPEDQMVYRWVKMSKSKGNVVTPDEMAEKYGADSLRVYEMFVAPFEDNVQWSEEGINGAFRFLNRVWRWLLSVLPVYSNEWASQAPHELSEKEKKIRRKLHQTIAHVEHDIEHFGFNTAIAALMELVNDLYAYSPVTGGKDADNIVLSESAEALILMLSPFTPHMAEELWQLFGHEPSIYRAPWPAWDAATAAEEEIVLPIMINGKVKERIKVSASAGEEEIREIALNYQPLQEAISGKTIRKIIVVPGKMISIVL